MWEEYPDIYGVRRSARSRKEVDRFQVIKVWTKKRFGVL